VNTKISHGVFGEKGEKSQALQDGEEGRTLSLFLKQLSGNAGATVRPTNESLHDISDERGRGTQGLPLGRTPELGKGGTEKITRCVSKKSRPAVRGLPERTKASGGQPRRSDQGKKKSTQEGKKIGSGLFMLTST